MRNEQKYLKDDFTYLIYIMVLYIIGVNSNRDDISIIIFIVLMLLSFLTGYSKCKWDNKRQKFDKFDKNHKELKERLKKDRGKFND